MPRDADDDIHTILSGADDSPELRRFMSRIPTGMMGAAAIRMAWKQRDELLSVHEIARKWDESKENDAHDRGLILRNLGLISARLGILEVDELGTVVLTAEPLAGSRMAVQFSDGSSGIVNVASLLHQPGWSELRDDAKFKLLVIQNGNVLWPNPGLQLTVKTLYAMAHGMPPRKETTATSQRPVSHHEFQALLAANLPAVEQAESDQRWIGFRNFLKDIFKDGVVRGAKIAIGSLVAAGALIAAGYFIRDCRQAITGNHHVPIPKIHAVGED